MRERYPAMLRVGVLAVLAAGSVLVAGPTKADEAGRPGPRALAGTLVLSGGRLALQGTDGKELARGEGLGRVRLGGLPKCFAALPAHVVQLSADERLTGVFLGMQGDTIGLRTAWSERVGVPLARPWWRRARPGAAHGGPRGVRARAAPARPRRPVAHRTHPPGRGRRPGERALPGGGRPGGGALGRRRGLRRGRQDWPHGPGHPRRPRATAWPSSRAGSPARPAPCAAAPGRAC